MEVHADPGAGVWAAAQQGCSAACSQRCHLLHPDSPSSAQTQLPPTHSPRCSTTGMILESDLMPGTVSTITYTCTKWGLYAYLNEVRIGIGLVRMHKFS